MPSLLSLPSYDDTATWTCTHDEPDNIIRVALKHEELTGPSADVAFLIYELADSIARGYQFYSGAGWPLDSINQVLWALASDGSVYYEDDEAQTPVGH